MNELFAQWIIESLEADIFKPSNASDYTFEELSYARWAAYEISELLMNRPHDSPDLIIEEFMLKMTVFEASEDDSRRKRIFAVARETAEDMLTIF